MTEHDQRLLEGQVVEDHPAGGLPQRKTGHGGHGWMMIACCIPMLVIAVILVATGTASPGFLVAAVGCTLMMRGMGHGDDRSWARRLRRLNTAFIPAAEWQVVSLPLGDAVLLRPADNCPVR